MPIHDWTRVTAGTFHDFHLAWIAELRRALNGGLLPPGYYAQAEQVAGQVIPDVLTLQDHETTDDEESARPSGNGDGGVAVAQAPPRVAMRQVAPEAATLLHLRRRLVIRHTTGDRIVALLEIVSAGNKSSQSALSDFLDKVAAALKAGYHLLIVDLFPPGTFDPNGLHAAIWNYLSGVQNPRPDKPLTLASYVSELAVTAYVEPTKVGDALTPMPLFLNPAHYVNVPLEATYNAAYEGVPARWKRVIEGVH